MPKLFPKILVLGYIFKTFLKKNVEEGSQEIFKEKLRH